MNGATTLAEGGREFKVDVDLIFNNLRATDRKCILRTFFDDLGVWKEKYTEVNISPAEGRFKNQNQNKDNDNTQPTNLPPFKTHHHVAIFDF